MNTRTRVETKSENFSGVLAAPAGTVLVLVNILVPPRATLRPRAYGNYLGVVANWAKVRWDFLVNGCPMYPYVAIRDQIGYGAARQTIEGKSVPGGSLFQITVTQESGVADNNAGVSFEWDMEYPS